MLQALLDAGAKVVGKNVMDEMAFSLQGDNAHYGTPVNPACPDRLPGGSSSGTAAAVAAGDADIGLGVPERAESTEGLCSAFFELPPFPCIARFASRPRLLPHIYTTPSL